MYQPFFPTITPEKAEQQKLRRGANFSGLMLLMMLAANIAVSVVLIVFGLFGVLNLSVDGYGLDNTGYLLLNMLVYVLLLPVPALAVAAFARSRINPFPFRKVRFGLLLRLFAAGMGMAILSNLLSGYLMNFLTSFGVPYPHFPETMELTTTSLVLNIISTAVLPAIFEEMVFRGYIQTALRPFGDGIAIVLTAFLFGIFHGNILQFPFAFLLGLVFGWLLTQTGSIWPCVVLHFGNNLMSTLLDWFAKAYPDYQNAQITTVFTLAAALGVIALGSLLVSDRGGSDQADVLRPIHNGASILSVSCRVRTALFSPAMLIAIIVLVLELVVSMVSV